MELHNLTSVDIELASRHVIKANGCIEATPDVVWYPDNRVAISMGLANGSLKLQKPQAKKPTKVKDVD
jgi:hypothetical protein